MEISFCSHPNTNKVIATIFGTWHDSWAVVACAKFCCDMVISNWIRAKWNFHRIWIVMEKSLVKWVPAQQCVMHAHQSCIEGQLTLAKQSENINIFLNRLPLFILRSKRSRKKVDYNNTDWAEMKVLAYVRSYSLLTMMQIKHKFFMVLIQYKDVILPV